MQANQLTGTTVPPVGLNPTVTLPPVDGTDGVQTTMEDTTQKAQELG